jgi:hypothetical protein
MSHRRSLSALGPPASCRLLVQLRISKGRQDASGPSGRIPTEGVEQ